MDNKTVDLISRWESEGLPEDELAGLFNHLIQSGLAWNLQGMYGREAISLMQSGVCEVPTFDTLPPRAQEAMRDWEPVGSIYVLDDGETWSGGGAEIPVRRFERDRIESGEKPSDVIPNLEGYFGE